MKLVKAKIATEVGFVKGTLVRGQEIIICGIKEDKSYISKKAFKIHFCPSIESLKGEYIDISLVEDSVKILNEYQLNSFTVEELKEQLIKVKNKRKLFLII